MCGIAGWIDLAGRAAAPSGLLTAMADAIVHRGPDEDGFLERPGVGLASRRLSIVGLADGRQPISNEDRSVWVVFNGELFDYPEQRRDLESHGHRFRTSTDTELVPHAWEQYGTGFLDHLRGQFAFCLYDERRGEIVLARDRFGICPLFFTRVRPDGGDVLLFASEIKALLATGLVEAEADRFGLNGIFTYFAMPGPRTCFAGVTSLLPGQFLRIRLGEPPADPLKPRFYWQPDFPDRGQEDFGRDERRVIDEFEEVLLSAVSRRLRADVPVVSYLSGGIDSSQVVAMASKVLGRPIPTFTVGVRAAGLNEEPEAKLVADHVGSESVVVPYDAADVMNVYPDLIRAAEMPVIDTACGALLTLARSVHDHGYKVALTGEGSDEFLAGYPWFKWHALMGRPLHNVLGVPLAQLIRRGFMRAQGLPLYPWDYLRRTERSVGGPNAWLEVYGIMYLSRLMFFSEQMTAEVGDHVPFEDLGFDLDRFSKWHPYNRSLAVGARTMLGGMLLLCKGDRVAMNSSVETRYPFLDERLFAFLAKLHPRWKARGLTDKILLRKVAERWLPQSIARRAKAMFRAPMDCFHLDDAPPYVNQLLSEESLRKTGYFNPVSVAKWRAGVQRMIRNSPARTAVEMGLVGVVATQLWHQIYIDPSIADVPRPGAAAAQPTWAGATA